MNVLAGAYTEGVDFWLPTDWASRALELSTHAYHVRSEDPSSITHELGFEQILDYYVVDGLQVRHRAPWLIEAYWTTVADLASKAVGQRVRCATDPRIGVNLNVMRPEVSTYRWHIDSNPVTALLFVTTLGQGEGGEFEVLLANRRYRLRPTRGQMLVFDGRTIPHYVRSVSGGSVNRVSIAFTYYLGGGETSRPADIDSHIYGTVDF